MLFMQKLRCYILFSLFVFLCFISYSQQYSNEDYSLGRPIAHAYKTDSSPLFDGQVIDDSFWQKIETIGDFTQTQPESGKQSSEKTEVRIAYNENVFWIAVVCYDNQVDKLVVTDSRRDASLDNTDSFLFILDTYKDGQNGFLFGTNSIGIQYDGQVSDEGQDDFNTNWDGSWEVKTEVGNYGWSAEFMIPLRTLRYKTGNEQEWGINFRRNIQKTNEIAYWAVLPSAFDLKRLSLAGTLKGLDLQSPGNLKVIPYVLGQLSKDYTVDKPETNLDTEFGVDVKYSISPSMTLDLTYNTDFAQVEVDEQQINLNRFNLFFPEKRPFFLENAGLFSIGSPGEIDLFFSRRIGIGDNKELVPIIGGARLSGKVNKTQIGVLSMFTDEVEESQINKNNFSVARVSHEFAPRSAIGAAFINRSGLDSEDADFNRTYAADIKVGLGKKAQINGFYSKTDSPGDEKDNHAFNASAAYEWNGWILSAGYTEAGAGFNPEVGFMRRTAFRKPQFLIFYYYRPKKNFLGLLELRPHVSYNSYWNFDGFRETSFLHVDNHWEWKNGFQIYTGINFTSEGIISPFEIFKGIFVPPGTYNHEEAQIVFKTNQSRPFYFSTNSIIGGFFGGNRIENTITLGARIGDKFNTKITYGRNDINIPDGDFNTNLISTRLSYSFTPKIYLQSLIQYNDVQELLTANVRFGMLGQANAGWFIVYNESYRSGDIQNRGLFVKYSLVLDVLN
jgi:hypothetical protein